MDNLFAELERAFRGEHRIGRRRMLQCVVMREERPVTEYEALNDAVITKASLARMIDLVSAGLGGLPAWSASLPGSWFRSIMLSTGVQGLRFRTALNVRPEDLDLGVELLRKSIKGAIG